MADGHIGQQSRRTDDLAGRQLSRTHRDKRQAFEDRRANRQADKQMKD